MVWERRHFGENGPWRSPWGNYISDETWKMRSQPCSWEKGLLGQRRLLEWLKNWTTNVVAHSERGGEWWELTVNHTGPGRQRQGKHRKIFFLQVNSDPNCNTGFRVKGGEWIIREQERNKETSNKAIVMVCSRYTDEWTIVVAVAV